MVSASVHELGAPSRESHKDCPLLLSVPATVKYATRLPLSSCPDAAQMKLVSGLSAISPAPPVTPDGVAVAERTAGVAVGAEVGAGVLAGAAVAWDPVGEDCAGAAGGGVPIDTERPPARAPAR